jgi:hypothetical protein
MAQIFHPSTNTISKLSIVGVLLAVPLIGIGSYGFNMSYGIALKTPLEQPAPFSHKHHVGDDGIDCRYCHTSVEKSGFAGVPATEICMTCHSQIWTDSPNLEPVRESFQTGQPLVWARVHDLPDFVYFNHSIHLKNGISCVSCHGRVDEMPITYKQETLSMRWCIDCHRHPEKNMRPRAQVFNMAWKPETPEEAHPKLTEDETDLKVTQTSRRAEAVTIGSDTYHIMSEFQMTNCSTCHR